MKKPRKAQSSAPLVPPPFTGRLDACVPAENVILSHYVDTAGQWVAASEASDGRVFLGRAKTEPLARRAAGLRALAHLESRASGAAEGGTAETMAQARAELEEQLEQLVRMIDAYNGTFPPAVPREAAALQLRVAQMLVRHSDDQGVLARWLLPPLLFLGGAFAEGVIGVYAEKALKDLSQFLSA
jgi:hypothetical protein